MNDPGPLDAPVEGPGVVSEAVLDVVERIPPGRVMSYGAIAAYLGLPTPRMVGAIMAREGGAVPWHRVVNSVGRLPPHKELEARARLEAEGAPFRGERVDMRAAAWWPEDTDGAGWPEDTEGAGWPEDTEGAGWPEDPGGQPSDE